MNILVWNVRGFNDLLKQKGVVSRIRFLKANAICVGSLKVVLEGGE